MFNNDVTKTYTQQDATLEILIMLGGAFLLGCLLCWLIRSLIKVNKHESVNKKSSIGGIKATTEVAPSVEKQSFSSENTHHGETEPSHYSNPRIDDFTKISGVNKEIENELRKRDVKSYIDLRDSDKEIILDTLKSANDQSISEKEAQTWPHQANLAAKGEWEKLREYQDFISRRHKTVKETKQRVVHIKSNVDETLQDDLKKIEGIGPKIEEVLNKNAIYTFKDLRKSNRDTLRKYLDDAGNRFKMHEPESWPHQASMAERGEWEELKRYQEFMDGGREIPSQSAFSKIEFPVQPVIDDLEAEYNQELDAHDDLKKIEGIGPKIEKILNEEGITTFEALHKVERDTLKDYLDKAGNQFKMHEPESWPHQAGMAATGQWEELGIYQEFMDRGREVPSGSVGSRSSLSSTDEDKKEFDDLKKIEGIGPKLQNLLNNADIKNYEDLKNSSVDFIRKLLNDAGPQYRMHDPVTWPTQASLADENQWEELKEYQEEIIKKRAKQK